MQPTSRLLERIVFGGLIVVILVISIAFIRSRQGPKLPVFNQVTDFTLTNQNNQAVSLADLRGEVWIADVIFTRCQMQCLLMTKNMVQLQTQLPGVKFVSLTADPGFDTSEVLKTYAQRFNAGENWIFLTGLKSNVYSVAINGLKLAVDDVKPEERENINDLFIHSKQFILVDKKGRVRGWFDGDTAEFNPQIIEAAKKLLKE
jgi:protein SCO1/2